MSTIAFTQTEESTEQQVTPKAIKFDEFEKTTNGYVKMKMDAFFTELESNSASQGYIPIMELFKKLPNEKSSSKIQLFFADTTFLELHLSEAVIVM
jgi:hypothetical protein